MNVWLTRLRARCACGCSFEAFALPPEEAKGRWVARTRSGFAAMLHEDRELLALLRRFLAEGGVPELPPLQLVRLASLLGDPAPDGRAYDTALGLVCPRCEAEPTELKIDKQMPEMVMALPLVQHERWFRLPQAEKRAAVLALAEKVQPAGSTA